MRSMGRVKMGMRMQGRGWWVVVVVGRRRKMSFRMKRNKGTKFEGDD